MKIRTLFYLLFSMLTTLTICSQNVGHAQVTFTDPARSNRQIPTEVYYPSATTGNNTAISTGTYPIIIFGHGFVMAWSSYQNIWDDLVPLGYILVFPTTEGAITPSHQNFGDDLKFLAAQIKVSGAGVSVPLANIGSTSAIMGHSMGGGSSFLSAKNNTAITTMISFAAANTNPSSIISAQNISVPTLIFSGVNDCVAPPAAHQDSMYTACSSSYKTQIYITGGGHCYFANNNFSCSFGEGTCSPSPAITRPQQQDVTSDLLKLWLEYYLKGNCSKAQQFQDSLMLSNRITYRQNQSIACAVGLESIISVNSINIFPNPSEGIFTISSESNNIDLVQVYDLQMREQISSSTSYGVKKAQLDITNLSSGIYLLKVNNSAWSRIVKD